MSQLVLLAAAAFAQTNGVATDFAPSGIPELRELFVFRQHARSATATLPNSPADQSIAVTFSASLSIQSR
jgi:hypothetical protein